MLAASVRKPCRPCERQSKQLKAAENVRKTATIAISGNLGGE